MMLRRDYDELLTQNIANRSIGESSKQEYEILLEFDLRREKEKNMILEERLKNKETFIQQMKTFQEELTTAYQQCKNQLIVAQQKIEYLQNVQYREYQEQIADLKHILSMKNQESKRKSIENAKKSMFSSANGQFVDQDVRNKFADRRDSKTISKINTKREGLQGDPFQLQVSQQRKKVANFINHFVQMAECYIEQLKEEEKLTKKLKTSWKWIKEVVRQWDNLTTKTKEWQSFKDELTQLYQTDEDVDFSILFQLIRNDRSSNKS